MGTGSNDQLLKGVPTRPDFIQELIELPPDVPIALAGLRFQAFSGLSPSTSLGPTQ